MIVLRFDKLADRQLRKNLFASADKIVVATGKAIHDTNNKMRTMASDDIRKTILVKKRDIDKRIRLVFVANNANGNTEGGIIIRRNRPISLSKLTRKPRQTKKGVTYEAKRGKKVLLPSAFGPKITKLHNSVYVRTTKSRLPIATKQYLDLAADWDANATVDRISRQASDLFQHNLQRRLNELRLREAGKIK